MNRKLFVLFLLFIGLGSISAMANEGEIRGKVVSRGDRQSVQGAKVILSTDPSITVRTSDDGSFSFISVPYGIYTISIESDDYQNGSVNVRHSMSVTDVNFVSLIPKSVVESNYDPSMYEFTSENENDSQSSPISLSASKDAYGQASSFTFSAMRFRNRGYDSNSQTMYMNGIQMNDALTGSGGWNLWSGLNEVTRSQELANSNNTLSVGVGGINGSTNINTRPSSIRKGFRASAMTTNSTYRLRLMATYGSGNLDNGWSYALSVSTRQGGNDYVEGTYYNSWAYYAGVEKEINSNHRMALSIMGSPSERGAQAAVTQEVYDLVGNNYYNPNWGWQNGKRRASRVRKNHEPVAMLNYIFTPDEKTTLNVAASYRFGKNGYSTFDWYDAKDPRPDYYKNLPSYYYHKDELGKAEEIAYNWYENYNNIRHINWDELYNVNYNSTDEYKYNLASGETVNFGSGRAKYIVSERHIDQQDFNAAVNLARIVNTHSDFNAGLDLKVNRSEYYNMVKDILGGGYWLNINNFAERDFKQEPLETLMNDVSNTSNLVVKEGDKYGYDYYAHVRNARVWGDYNFNVNNWRGFAAAEAGYSLIWREGIYQNGLFPDNSKGKSDIHKFLTYTAKAGVTYSINSNNHISASASYMEKAPYFQDIFVSPRTRNEAVNNLNTDKYLSADLTYIATLPFMDLRLTGFFTKIKDRNDLQSFYDDLQNSFTNFAISNMDQHHVGIEAGIKVPIYKGLSLVGAVSYGEYVYDSNPVFTQTVDNDARVVRSNETIYWKGLKVEGTPQLAANAGLKYRTENNWYFGIDCGYFDELYISMNPLLRTDYALEGINDYNEMKQQRAQEKTGSAFVVNADISKNWYIGRKYNFGFSLQGKNLLNSTDIKTGGYEQVRLRTDSNDSGDKKTPFDSKYFYMLGATYSLNVYFRF